MEWQLSLTDLILGPVTLPARGFLFLVDEIRQQADRELYDPQTLQERLIELQMRYELGELTEAEYRKGWAQVSQRLANLGAERTVQD